MLFAKHGTPIIDADIIAREITQPGHVAYQQIRKRWGDTCFISTGELDRTTMRKRVFSIPKELAALEAILHPEIEKEIEDQKQRLAQQSHTYCVIVIPLLIEKNLYHLIDQLIVVDVPKEIQITRTMQRDKITRKQVESILNKQATREERLQKADFIIDNSAELEALGAQVSKVDRRIKARITAQMGDSI
jgi:dephospho-CoA kinase